MLHEKPRSDELLYDRIERASSSYTRICAGGGASIHATCVDCHGLGGVLTGRMMAPVSSFRKYQIMSYRRCLCTVSMFSVVAEYAATYRCDGGRCGPCCGL